MEQIRIVYRKKYKSLFIVFFMALEKNVQETSQKTTKLARYKLYDAVPIVGVLTYFYRNREREMRNKGKPFNSTVFDQCFGLYQTVCVTAGLLELGNLSALANLVK